MWAEQLRHRVQPLAVVLRWVTVVVGTLAGAFQDPGPPFYAAATILLVLAVALSLERPRAWEPRARTVPVIVLELVVAVGAAALTGGLRSPFVLAPLAGLLLAGYVFGRSAAVGTTVAGACAAGATIVLQGVEPADESAASQLAIVYLLCGTLGAFTRNLVIELEHQRAAALDQATVMATANELLVSLHALTQTMPASFDLGDVVTSIRDRIRTVFAFGALVVLVRDEQGSGWRVELAEGVRMPARVTDDDLPAAARRALGMPGPVVVADRIAQPDEEGFAALTRSGLYAALRARDALVGLVALEHVPPDSYDSDDAGRLDSLTGLFALSIDNARWFGRIRTIGAEAERVRIARELHDRVAQALAYVTFELERLQAGPGDPREELAALHQVVRGIVRELRETIYQLRADVTEERDLAAVAGEYLDRWSRRTGIAVSWRPVRDDRLPLPVEQELWRILQEALVNVERHAAASHVEVTWEVHDGGARLTVVDDGRGFDPGGVGGDHYGLVGMRERSDAIGARLDVHSRPGGGTRVSVEIASRADRTDQRRSA